MPLDKRRKNKTTIYHYYTSSRKTMIYGIIITRDEGQSFNHSQASKNNYRKGSHIFIHMHGIYKNTHIYKYILSNVVKFTVLM